METILFGLVGQLGSGWFSSILWYTVIALFLTHITILTVTLFAHRSKTHGSVDFNPVIEHFFRFWMWLTTGMKTDEWVAVHRKHHAHCETENDPHSPKVLGIRRFFKIGGVKLYKQALAKPDIYDYVSGKYAKSLPNDWVEHNVYSKHPWLGLIILGSLQVLLLGLPGLIIFGIQAYWIPIWAANVINGIGHYWGYRNADTPDESRNIFPIGVLIGGEELHNNHHAYQTSAKFSKKWWEFDIGWMYICILEWLGLAKVNQFNHFPVSVHYANPLPKEARVELFRRHKYYISKQFKKATKDKEYQGKVAELVEIFRGWSEREKQFVTAFELDKWVSEIRQYGTKELINFANWFLCLHEADEVPDSTNPKLQ